jgi:TonB family protein
MTRRAALLFPAALGVSAAAHILLLFLLPYAPAQPAARPSALIPVSILERPPPTPPPPAAPRQLVVCVAPAVPRVEPAPVAAPEVQPVSPPAPQPEVAQSPLELATLEPAADQTAASSGWEPSTAGASSETGTKAGAAHGSLSAEIAATQAVLSSLRGRIAEKIRYQALARSRGWKGAVLLVAFSDNQGRLQHLVVRKSSGYSVLDQTAAALVRRVTPIGNPLGRSLSIEIPIVHELKEK